MFQPKLVAIVGPTASGKTDLAIKLAKKLKGAVISADSRQIYKGIPIGTNQPKGKWKKFLDTQAYFVKDVPHFFIDILLPNKNYNVVHFQKTCHKLLPKLQQADYLPILVGGSGLYVSSIVEGYKFPKGKPNFEILQQLEKLTLTQLLNKLKQADAISYKKIDKKNRRRIIRALEYNLTTSQRFWNDRDKIAGENFLVLGLSIDRSTLYKKINERVDKMMKAGLLKEIKWLIKNYPHSPALATIGYQELIPVIKSGKNLNQAIELVKQHTRNFAKRQMTWFKRMLNVKWVTPDEAENLVKEI